MLPQVDALQPLAEHLRRQPLHPLVEVAEHDLRLADAAVVDDGAQPARLVPALEERRAEVHVVEVQRVVADGDVDALAAARLARLPRQVVLRVMEDRKPAEDDVAEQAAAQCRAGAMTQPMPSSAPSSSACPAKLRAGADDLLQRDDVGLDAADDVGDAVGTGAAVESAAAVDVVGGDPQGSPVRSAVVTVAESAVQRSYCYATILSTRIAMAKLKSELELTCPCCGARWSSTSISAASSRTRSRSAATSRSWTRPTRILAAEAARREALFEQSVQAEKGRDDALSRRFEEALKQASKEPITKPTRDFDLD